MNEQAYQDQMEDDAQFEAEQEALREVACAKYEDFKPLLKEMIDHSLDIAQVDMYDFLIDDKEKLNKLMSDCEWKEAIRIMELYTEG